MRTKPSQASHAYRRDVWADNNLRGRGRDTHSEEDPSLRLRGSSSPLPDEHRVRFFLGFVFWTVLVAGLIIVVDYLWGYNVPLAASLLCLGTGSLGILALFLTERE